MAARCFAFFDDDLRDPPPPTSRAPAADLARLVALTAAPDRSSEIVTPFSGVETVALVAMALGADTQALERLRSSYANGDCAAAVAYADVFASSLREDIVAGLDEASADGDPFGGLIPVIEDDMEDEPEQELGDDDIEYVLEGSSTAG